MADKNYELTFKLSDGSEKSVGFTAPQGDPGKDGKTAYEYAKDGGYTGTEEEFAAKLAAENPGGGGVSSYNDLTDKPTETIGGDTLTWDGNTDTVESLPSPNEVFYKVSNAIVMPEQLTQGFSFSGFGVTDVIPVEGIVFGQGIAQTELVFFIYEDIGSGYSPGIYFLNDGEIFVSSITIPGYTGFAKEVLKPEILPEHNHKWENITDRPFFVTTMDDSGRLKMTPQEIHDAIWNGKGVFFANTMTPFVVETDDTGEIATEVHTTLVSLMMDGETPIALFSKFVFDANGEMAKVENATVNVTGM